MGINPKTNDFFFSPSFNKWNNFFSEFSRTMSGSVFQSEPAVQLNPRMCEIKMDHSGAFENTFTYVDLFLKGWKMFTKPANKKKTGGAAETTALNRRRANEMKHELRSRIKNINRRLGRRASNLNKNTPHKINIFKLKWKIAHSSVSFITPLSCGTLTLNKSSNFFGHRRAADHL